MTKKSTLTIAICDFFWYNNYTKEFCLTLNGIFKTQSLRGTIEKVKKIHKFIIRNREFYRRAGLSVRGSRTLVTERCRNGNNGIRP